MPDNGIVAFIPTENGLFQRLLFKNTPVDYVLYTLLGKNKLVAEHQAFYVLEFADGNGALVAYRESGGPVMRKHFGNIEKAWVFTRFEETECPTTAP